MRAPLALLPIALILAWVQGGFSSRFSDFFTGQINPPKKISLDEITPITSALSCEEGILYLRRLEEVIGRLSAEADQLDADIGHCFAPKQVNHALSCLSSTLAHLDAGTCKPIHKPILRELVENIKEEMELCLLREVECRPPNAGLSSSDDLTLIESYNGTRALSWENQADSTRLEFGLFDAKSNGTRIGDFYLPCLLCGASPNEAVDDEQEPCIAYRAVSHRTVPNHDKMHNFIMELRLRNTTEAIEPSFTGENLLTFTMPFAEREHPGKVAKCVWFDERGMGAWSKDGCQTIAQNSTHISCACNRVGQFSLFFEDPPVFTAPPPFLLLVVLGGGLISLALTGWYFYWQVGRGASGGLSGGASPYRQHRHHGAPPLAPHQVASAIGHEAPKAIEQTALPLFNNSIASSYERPSSLPPIEEVPEPNPTPKPGADAEEESLESEGKAPIHDVPEETKNDDDVKRNSHLTTTTTTMSFQDAFSSTDVDLDEAWGEGLEPMTGDNAGAFVPSERGSIHLAPPSPSPLSSKTHLFGRAQDAPIIAPSSPLAQKSPILGSDEEEELKTALSLEGRFPGVVQVASPVLSATSTGLGSGINKSSPTTTTSPHSDKSK